MFRDAPSDLKQTETKAATSYCIIINLFNTHFITKKCNSPSHFYSRSFVIDKF